MLEVFFLGTGGSIPTPERSLPSVAVRKDGELLIFDCGEGTQRQMMRTRLGFNRPTRIFISHMHGDHLLGLPGLFQTMSLLGRDKPLQVYGPRGIAGFVKALRDSVPFGLSFNLTISELRPRERVAFDGYTISTASIKHGIHGLSYVLVENDKPGRFHPEKAKKLGIPEGPLWSRLQHGQSINLRGTKIHPRQVTDSPRAGLKFAYAIDTRPSDSIVTLVKGADLLVHDGCFAQDRLEKARDSMHSTAQEAARVAKRARVRRLALVHISAAYRDSGVLLREARRIFSETIVPNDLQVVEVR